MLDKILKTEESKASIVILLTWLVFMPMIIIKVFSEFAIWALVMFGLVILGMVVSFLVSRRSRALKGLTADERTERFSLKSSRNGFFMAVVLTTVLAIIMWFRGSFIGGLDLLIWIWLWGTAAYQLSLFYYVMRG